MITAALRNAKGQTFQLKLKLEGGSLLFVVFGLLPPDGFRVREIGENETDKIAAVERNSPIELDDGRSYAVYRPRLGDYLRLQERTWRALIEHDGEPVAARVFAGRTLNLRGRPVVFATSQIARVLPSMRGFNLMLCFALWSGVAVAPNTDRGLAYVDLGNRMVNAAFRMRISSGNRSCWNSPLPVHHSPVRSSGAPPRAPMQRGSPRSLIRHTGAPPYMGPWMSVHSRKSSSALRRGIPGAT
jgi:hypothetical protein